MNRKLRFLEVASELGAGTRGASLGPEAVRLASLKKGYKYFAKIKCRKIESSPELLFEPIKYPTAKRLKAILEVNQTIAQEVHSILSSGNFPLILSGDHSNGIGVISGVRQYYREQRVGLIWIDAHGDLHSPFSSPSGNLHGMALGALLGLDNKHLGKKQPDPVAVESWKSLCEIAQIRPKILPRDLVLIGIRDLEKEEWDVIAEKNILYFSVSELDSLGVNVIMEKVLEHLQDCDKLAVSFDIDSLDALLVPGTGTPVAEGLSVTQAGALLQAFWKNEKLVSLEFTEVNPLLDLRNRTAGVAATLLQRILTA